MAEVLSTESIESSLGAAFGGEPVAAKPVAQPAPEVAEVDDALVADTSGDGDGIDPPVDAAAATDDAQPEYEPEFEVEVDGARELVRGKDRVQELIQKGLHYGKNSEAVAREREALAASTKQQQVVQHIQQAMSRTSLLQALDQQLEQWNKVDLGAMFDTDPFKALQLKEQRDQIRESRAAKFKSSSRKPSRRTRHSVRNHQRLAAEEQALIAKLPEWRNSERAKAEVGKITSWLQTQGYSKTESENVGDHRHMLLARKAYLYDQLMAGKDAKVKQVRTAQPMAKPGAAAPQTNGRVEFNKARAKLREFATKGNTRAQEDMVTRMFNSTFK
jgi:hypothetical protein